MILSRMGKQQVPVSLAVWKQEQVSGRISACAALPVYTFPSVFMAPHFDCCVIRDIRNVVGVQLLRW